MGVNFLCEPSMGVVLSCCAALACSCCLGASCSCFGHVMTLTKSIATRLVYTIIFLALSILAWIFDLYAYDILQYIPYINDSCYEDSCGTFSVYRITFSLFIFHILLSIVLIKVHSAKDIRAQINNGWWPLKIPALFVLIIASFFIPNTFFTYYAWCAIVGAGIFIVIQLIVLIDFAYSWSDSWVSKWEGEDGAEPQKSYFYALLGCTGVLYLTAAGIAIFSYVLFCSGDCWYNSIIITAVLLMGLFLSICSVHPKVNEFNSRAGLLQAAIFTLYCSYYTYSAILSEPTCGEFPISWSDNATSVTNYITIIFGAMFTIVSVVYASVVAGSSELVERKKNEESTLLEEGEEMEEREETGYSYSMFHLAFALGAMYIAMLLTNWNVLTGDTDTTTETDSGWVSFGVKLASCTFAGILYLWTVFAPAILKNREWDY